MFQGSASRYSKEICLPPASESLEFRFYNCKHSTELIFKLHPLLIARHIRFSTNYPVLDSNATFSRNTLYDLPWISTQAILPEFDPDRTISFTVDKSGAFCFIYTWTSVDGESIERRGYFIVEPKTIIPVESITLQTYIVRCLGTMDEWKTRLWLSKYCNYNAIHFTPVQERGHSDSAYSIRDHLKLHPDIVSTEVQAKLFSSQQSNLIKIENSVCADFTYEIDKGHMVLEECLRNLCSEWGLLRVVDLVWNHCSYDSTWLRDHPDAGYNLHNSPHLIPAYILDRELHLLSREIGEGTHEARYGVTKQVSHNDPHGYKSKLEMLLRELLPNRARLEAYFHINIEEVYSSVQAKLRATEYTRIPKAVGTSQELRIYNTGTRDGARIDEDLALKLFFGELTDSSSAGRVESCLANLRQALRQLNSSADQEVSRQLVAAISAVMGGFEWRFINSNGPKLAEIGSDSPIVAEYFFHLDGDEWLPDEQIGMQEHASRVLLHNGYVIDWNALKNMAAPDSNVFLRREVVIWGDSCKLNYGEKPEDNPWLWEYMRHYTIMMARLFDGFRIDNCHNTPLHVAEYFLDEARLINPNLLVIAELFTNSMETDSLFINRMGLNLLIRESLVASSPHSLGGLIYTFGGRSIGSLFHQKTLPSLGDTPLAIFYDVTHDNPTIIDKHSVFDVVPTTALIAMTACPTGSCRGYDELVPHMVHVVQEKRKYSFYKEEGMNYGVFKIKRELNRLHASMIAEGYTEIYVHNVTESVISITRHNPNTLDSYVLITHTSFFQPESAYLPTQQGKHKPFPIPVLSLEGQVTEVFLEAFLKRDTSVSFDEDKESINGLTGYVAYMKSNINPNRSKLIKVLSKQGSAEIAIEFTDFPPGAVIVLLLRSTQEALTAANSLRGFAEFQPISRVATINHVEGMNVRNSIDSEISKLGLLDFNFLLYHSEPEELELGGGVYEIPGYGKTVYAGLQGFVTILDRIRQTNDLGHPLCENIRGGNWMIEYIAKRLERRASLVELSKLILGNCSQLDKIPHGLKPSYFDLVITSLYDMVMHYCLTHFSPFVQNGSSCLRNLALGSVQLVSDCRSAPLPLHNSKSSANTAGSLAAGLPHFSAGRMRAWGRDTFIALHGLLVVTGRAEEAKQHILSFGSTLRHGMIPNLLAAGENSRYNCRDAPWWWIHSVKLYSKHTGDKAILSEKVTRLFASDESAAFAETEEEPLSEIIQEILQRHCDVIRFRERGAGAELDRDMTEEGFLVEAFVDMSTGFVCGGSDTNCGTWMDKMGSSEKAGNKGKPATPRNGSAVELVGLCKSVVTWLCELNEGGVYPYDGVNVKCVSSGEIVKFSFKAWGERIVDSFESKFWIPESREEAKEREGAMKEYINKTGFYKDSFGATHKWADYQLRPNFPIAMVVAPELFTPVNAKIALDVAGRLLLGPLGMRTLDRDDWAYRGSYIMCDSDEFNTAHGFNYHQGPEWLWLTGYFLQAKVLFCSGHTKEERMEVLRSVYEVLGRIGNCMLNSDWKNLPELTNENGSECAGSCPVQAWSIAAFIDTLYTIHNTLSKES